MMDYVPKLYCPDHEQNVIVDTGILENNGHTMALGGGPACRQDKTRGLPRFDCTFTPLS
jgi:hypothetical protein